MDETQEAELWRLRTIELDRDQWRANARHCGDVLEHIRADRDKLKSDCEALTRRIDKLADENASLDNENKELSLEVKSLRARVKLEEEYNFQVMEFRIAARHWTLQGGTEQSMVMLRPGEMMPMKLEYK